MFTSTTPASSPVVKAVPPRRLRTTPAPAPWGDAGAGLEAGGRRDDGAVVAGAFALGEFVAGVVAGGADDDDDDERLPTTA